MEVFLYNSTVCRLCGEENDSGTLLYSCEENIQNLSEVINTYLPIKVSDDGQLPRTICPGCTIQLEATIEFLDLIISGQKVIRELHQREIEYKKTLNSSAGDADVATEKLVVEINTNDGVYQVEHPVSLQVAGLDKPKRKRGRPPKKVKKPEEIAQEVAIKEREIAARQEVKQLEVPGKRRRKTPTRFREAVQGKELERIFIEEGVIDGEDSDSEAKPTTDSEAKTAAKEPEVIGHMETSGELVVVVKGKGRGRPKGRMRPTREECAICGMEFSCVGRYMSHIAQHGPVLYQCTPCGQAFTTRLHFQQHQRDLGHEGRRIIPRVVPRDTDTEIKSEETPSQEQSSEVVIDVEKLVNVTPLNSLPDLSGPEKEEETTEFIKSLVGNTTENSSDIKSSPVNKSDVAEVIERDPLDISEDIVVTGPKGKVKLKCPHCDKSFSSKQSKSLHIKAVHQGEKPYACSECGCKFAYPRSLALHAVSHRRHRGAARLYACDLCGKVLNHPSSVVYHKAAEHAGQRYVCSKCGKSFKHKQLLQRHQLVHSQVRPYTCKTCTASFKTKANLINHQLLHTGVKKFSCEICKHKFAHKTSLTLHMRWHTGLKPFVCKICNKSFSQKGNLSEHARIHTGEKPYQCTQCPRRFTTSSQYRLHARRHQPDRPYACAHCPKRFVSRGSWAAHQRREAGLRTHQCSVCQRAFTERWALLKHMRRHTGERPFRCPHCPRTFADCSNLNKHKKQVHKQVSLLVNDKSQLQQQQQQQAALAAEQESEADVQVAAGHEQDTEERVIFVTYDADDAEPAFHILDPEQAASLEDNKALATCELYSGPSLLVSQPELEELEQEHEQLELENDDLELSDQLISGDEHITVTDEQGNPLHFTMQDGTRLAITSTDGKSLQVITQDGQTIPVEINNGFTEEEEEAPGTVVHQLVQKEDSDDGSPITTYYAIV